MKFKLVINSDYLKTILESLTASIEEARLHLSPKGISLRAIDAAGIMMTYMTIPSEVFDYYKVDGEEGILALDLVNLQVLINAECNGDPCSMEPHEGKLLIHLGNFAWNVGLIDPNSVRKEPKVADMKMPTMAEIPLSEFRRIVKASEQVADDVRIGIRDSTFFAEAKDHSKEVKAKIHASDLLGMTDGESSSLFPLDCLKSISKAAKKAESIKLEIGVDYPMRASFSLPVETGAKVEVEFMCAPRIERD